MFVSIGCKYKCAMILIAWFSTGVIFIHTNTSYLIIKLVITHMTNACTKYVHFHNKLIMCAKSILLTWPSTKQKCLSTLNTRCSSLAGRIYALVGGWCPKFVVSGKKGLRQRQRPQAPRCRFTADWMGGVTDILNMLQGFFKPTTIMFWNLLKWCQMNSGKLSLMMYG